VRITNEVTVCKLGSKNKELLAHFSNYRLLKRCSEMWLKYFIGSFGTSLSVYHGVVE
jgi:hypothetical protein